MSSGLLSGWLVLSLSGRKDLDDIPETLAYVEGKSSTYSHRQHPLNMSTSRGV